MPVVNRPVIQVETMPLQILLIFYVLHPVSFLDGALVFAAHLYSESYVVDDDEVFVVRANDVALIVQRLVAVVYYDPYILHLASDPVVHEVHANSLAAIDGTACFWDVPKVELPWRLPTSP